MLTSECQQIFPGRSGPSDLLLVRRPLVLRDRALDIESLAGLHVVHVLRHGSVGVLLDDELDGALLVDVARRGVRPDDGLLHLGALVLGNDSSCARISTP